MAIAVPVRAARLRALLGGAVVRDACIAWIGQRVLLVALVWVWQLLASSASPRALLRVWMLWDARLCGDIASGGYQHLVQAAFFPLFPLLEHVVAPLTGGQVELAGMLVANASSLGDFVLLRLLVERDFNRTVARRALLYLAIFPTSMYLVAAYSEALFLLLVLGTFLALRERRWLLAGGLAALATLTRSAGLVLVLPIALAELEALRPRWSGMARAERVRQGLACVCAAAVPLAAYGGLEVYFRLRLGIWNAPGRAEGFWGRALDWPWTGLVNAVTMVIQHFPSVAGMDLLFALLWLAVACSMVIPRPRPLPAAYVAYTWASLLLVLLVPVHTPGASPLLSDARILLVVFPWFVRLAQWTLAYRRPYAHYVVLAASASQLVALTWLFARGNFVA